MDQVRRSRCIDVSSLPDDVVALIDALAGGEDLVITRGDEPVATISPMATAAAPTQVPGPSTGSVSYDHVTVVACALHLSRHVRSLLADSLGEDYVLLDFNAAPATADVLLVPPGIGLTLLSRLRGSFPRARVMVIEASDDSLGLSSSGPVRRLMDAGVETYLVSPTIPALAEQLEVAVTRPAQLTGAEGNGRARLGTRLEIDAGFEP
jgi:antitoxin (DNA-binding transcriptional repressor) of toxin-antitoxin stability system